MPRLSIIHPPIAPAMARIIWLVMVKTLLAVARCCPESISIEKVWDMGDDIFIRA